VGAGGAGFPSHLKLQTNADVVIANGAECEPLLHSDQYIMLHQPHYLINGLRAVIAVTGAKQAYIALKAHYHQAISALKPHLERIPQLKLHLLEDFYPAGDEHTLVHEVTGRLVPEGGIPPQAGMLVNNVTTLVQIGKALEGEAVTTRIVTVMGEVKTPQVLQVPLGTLLGEAVEAAGGARLDDYALIKGGPMMGQVAKRDDVVTKTTSGIIVLSPDHLLIRQYSTPPLDQLKRARSACEGCRMCTDLCPRFLLGHNIQPHLMIRAFSYQREDMAAYFSSAFLCCQCGICDMLACPCHLSPRALYAKIKREFARLKVENPHHLQPPQPQPDRKGRRSSLTRVEQALGLVPYNVKPGWNSVPLMPDFVRIKLLQHIGTPAQPLVKPGERIKKGQLIAQPPADKMGALIHASITGVVSAINGDFVEIRTA
jgi:Na+-translocating ferredoxin:NAD+ oxidoreductase RnfC subunit